jgi:DNA-binding PadR family transcriptional regulator
MAAMEKPAFLGEVEQLVLMALLHLGKGAYGAAVWREIEKRGNRPVLGATVYATLDRLENKEYIKSEWGEATAVRGGRAKKFYKITKSGHTALSRAMRAVNDMQEGLEFEFSTR